MLKGLIYKDYRLLKNYFRLCLAGTFLGYLVVYPLLLLFPNFEGQLAVLSVTLMMGSNFGFVLTCLAAAVISGSIFTLERSDRSADFLASLPPTRWQNLQSKLLVLVGMLVTLLAINSFAALAGYGLLQNLRIPEYQQNQPEGEFYLSVITIAFSIAGVAWAFSSILQSNGVPVLLGLLSPLVGYSTVVTIAFSIERRLSNSEAMAAMLGISFTLGVLGFASGCYWYLNRRDP
jgi:ABC-type transport system involved in multi-copper enzyme maturation permease subunit